MNNPISELKKHYEAIVLKLKDDLKSIRTNHASPALLENIEVEVYGGSMKMRLMELATINNDSPTVLAVVPFDPTTTQDIERAIQKSPLGLSPSTQTNKIIITLPALSEEQRNKYVKLANEMEEEYRQILRGYRDEIRKKIKHAFELKEVSEDEKYRYEKQVDEETQKANEQVQLLKEKKEIEIKTV